MLQLPCHPVDFSDRGTGGKRRPFPHALIKRTEMDLHRLIGNYNFAARNSNSRLLISLQLFNFATQSANGSRAIYRLQDI